MFQAKQVDRYICVYIPWIMAKISVKVLYDERLNFLGEQNFSGGNLISVTPAARTIDVLSVQEGTRYLPGSITAYPNTSGVIDVPLLVVRDPFSGVFYLDMTQAEYDDLITNATQSPNKTILFEHTVTLSEAGTTFDFDGLDKSTVVGSFVDGVFTDISYTSNSDGTATIVFPVALVEGSKISIQYYKN